MTPCQTTNQRDDRRTLTRGHRILKVAFIGGFLDGAVFDLSHHLSCIIGGRGAGKSTFLEIVRWALDGFRGCTKQHKGRVLGLVTENLGDGRVVVTVETAEGLQYNVSRPVGEPPVILSVHGESTDIELSAADLIWASVYSQNEIESIADNPVSQLALIDSFEPEEIQALNDEMEPIAVELERQVADILALQKQIGQLTKDVSTLPFVEEQMKAASKRTARASAELDDALKVKSQRERERTGIEEALRILQEQREAAESRTTDDCAEAEAAARRALGGPNHELVEPLAEVLQRLRQEISDLHRQELAALDAAQGEFIKRRNRLYAVLERQELAFAKVKNRHARDEEIANERLKWEKRHDELVVMKRAHEAATSKLTRLLDQREKLLCKLRELRNQRYRLRGRIVARINSQLSSNRIRVSIQENKNVAPLYALLADALEGASLQRFVVAEKVAERMQPSEIVAAVMAGDANKLATLADINQEQAKVVIVSLLASRALLELESIELLDLPRIELRDGKVYKDSLKVSTGQKCTAILPILLLESTHPLLVDQPEDNLDNGFVYETVVKSVADIKKRRQLVFVTHNANIPVLGDAEKMFVLESDGRRARIARSGDVSACRQDVLDLLEGGKEAFAERGRRYGNGRH